ncbi:MAG: class I SAM-dependent methyltransferase [Chitinispirillaceae bacterium]|nr:class I SAM-dependent methyltransferase [Chitinispirillaceae bacterium]
MIYDVLAPIYDRIMSHVDYDEWAQLIERIIHRYITVRDPCIFELGAGTGALSSLLISRGFHCVGSDRSFSMCTIAHRRKVPCICADARAVPLKKKFDLICFLYDGINYLQTLEDYALLFSETAKCLSPGSYLLFDITTEANSLNHFGDYLEHEDWGDYAYVRHSYYSKEKTEQHNDFTVYRQTARGAPLYEKKTEFHCQKVFSADAIARAVPVSVFTVEGMWDGFSFRRCNPCSERIHFLLKRTSS